MRSMQKQSARLFRSQENSLNTHSYSFIEGMKCSKILKNQFDYSFALVENLEI